MMKIQLFTLIATASAGFEFSGWSGDLSGTTNPSTITMDGNKTVTATFTEVVGEQFTFTAGMIGSGSLVLDPPGGTYNSGTVVTVTAVPAPGFQFVGFAGDIGGVANPSTITMNSNKLVTVIFTQVSGGQFTLSATPVGSGTVAFNPPGGVYDAGTVVTLTATPSSGGQFLNWSGDLSGSSNPATITVDANKSVTATFTEVTAEQFNLIMNTIGTGSVILDPAGGVYDAGTVVTVTAVPGVGFEFASWSGDLTGTTSPATITVNAN